MAFTPRDRLREAMADRRIGRLAHRGVGVTVYLFDGEIIAADGQGDVEAVMAALAGDSHVRRADLAKLRARIDEGGDAYAAMTQLLPGPAVEAALVERFRANLSKFVASTGDLDVERDRTGIPLNMQQGVDVRDIVGEPPPRPRDPNKNTLTPPPVPRTLRQGATARIAVTPVPVSRAGESPPAAGVSSRRLRAALMIVVPVAVLTLVVVLALEALRVPDVIVPAPTAPPPVAPPPVAPTPAAPPPDELPTSPVEPTPPVVVAPPVEPPPQVKGTKRPAVPNVPAADLLGEWRGTLDGNPSGVIVQVGEGTTLAGVFFTTDASGRHDVPVRGKISGRTVVFEGSGLEFSFAIEGWQLQGRCRLPGQVAADCVLVRRQGN